MKRFKKKKAGKVLFQLESELRTSPITQMLSSIIGLSIVIMFVSIVLLNRIPNEYFLNHSIYIYLIVYNLYLDFFANALVKENGLFVRGRMIQWKDIKSYKWKVPRLTYLKGYTNLLIKKEARLWIDELQLMTNDSQKLELDKFLQQKIILSGEIG